MCPPQSSARRRPPTPPLSPAGVKKVCPLPPPRWVGLCTGCVVLPFSRLSVVSQNFIALHTSITPRRGEKEDGGIRGSEKGQEDRREREKAFLYVFGATAFYCAILLAVQERKAGDLLESSKRWGRKRPGDKKQTSLRSRIKRALPLHV